MSRYYVPKEPLSSGIANRIGSQIIASIYAPDEAAFDSLIASLDDINRPLGTGRGKWNAMMFCIHKRRNNMVRKLLRQGASPDCLDHSTRRTGLHSACTGGYGHIARLLLETEAVNINHKANAEGESPLLAAVKKSRKLCVELLLNDQLHGQVCDINVQLKANGQTPLLIACDKGDPEIVRLLLQYQSQPCDVNLCDHKGYTPLMKAVAKGHKAVVRMLLSNRRTINPVGPPDVTRVNYWAECATFIAVKTNHFELAQLLLRVPGNSEVLWRKCHSRRTLLQTALVDHRLDRRIAEDIISLLHEHIQAVFSAINSSPKHQDVPYLPNGVVQFICNATY